MTSTGLVLVLVIVFASNALAGDVRAWGHVVTGDSDDLMYSTDGGVTWKGWPPGEWFDLETCLWVKANNEDGVIELICRCLWPGCDCKVLEVSKRPGGKSKVHIPPQNSGWPKLGDRDRQEGATLYELTGGILEVIGGGGCEGTPEACLAEQVGFNTPYAQACGEWEEPPEMMSWFIADHDTILETSRFLNHPVSAMPLLSRSISGPDTVTIYSIFPGEGLIYDQAGPRPAGVGIFVTEHPMGMPGTWAPVSFEVVNTGISYSVYDIFLWNDLGWSISEQYFNVFLNPGEAFIVNSEVFIPGDALPHTVCPVFAKASGQDDAHVHGARLRVMPDVTIQVIPTATIIARGDELILTALARNNTDSKQLFEGWTEVVLPNHKPYPGNPVAGPQTIFLGPHVERKTKLKHKVPYNAPIGAYVYTGCVGTYSRSDILDQDSFGFQVIE
jgi:hypothetical protein